MALTEIIYRSNEGHGSEVFHSLQTFQCTHSIHQLVVFAYSDAMSGQLESNQPLALCFCFSNSVLFFLPIALLNKSAWPAVNPDNF